MYIFFKTTQMKYVLFCEHSWPFSLDELVLILEFILMFMLIFFFISVD